MMKKRFMAMLMTAMLVIASVPFTACAEEAPAEVLGGEAIEAVAEAVEAAEAAEEAAAVPAAEEPEGISAEAAEPAVDAGLLGTDPVMVKSYQELKGAVQAAVSGVETLIVLDDDINDMTSSLNIAAERIIVLDLNGYKLNRGLAEKEAQADGSVIAINFGASVTLRDSRGGGMVTGGYSTGGGGGIYVSSKATFTMEGGTISGNKSKAPGGGIYVVSSTEAKVVLKGGRIYGNEIYYNDKYCGAGVNFAGNIGSGGRMYVGGNAFVGNNVRIKDDEKTTSNAWLVDKLTIGTGENDVPKPVEGMSIGVAYISAPLPGQKVKFTANASEGDEQYFESDNKGFKVAYNSEDGGYLELQHITLSIDSEPKICNVGDDIRFTVKAPFVEDGTEVLVKEGSKTICEPKLTNGTAVFLVNAVEPGRFTYKASIENLGLNADTQVTVIDAPKTYFVVRFSTDGGAPVPERQQVIENGKATRPQIDPAKDGYVFAGWYADAGCTNPYDFNMPVDRDITIFAKWNKKSDPTPSSDDSSEPLFTGTWNNPVRNGVWKQDANGVWSYTTTQVFRNTWGYIENPYAGAGQNKADWFLFDQYGHMLTGWQLKGGKWYYLNPTKDGTLGACLLGPGKTPDGWEIDETGAWTGK